MNNEDIKAKAEEIQNRLERIDYDNFAYFNARTSFPERLSEEFLKVLSDLEQLITQLPHSFPVDDIQRLFNTGRDVVNPIKSLVLPDDLASGKEILSQALNMIIVNAEPPPGPPEPPEPDPPDPSRTAEIFISYYENQTLEDVTSVFEMLDQLKPDINLDEIESVARSQLSGIGEIVDRIEAIRACTGAIICFPHQEALTADNTFIHFDLGACMASFPDNVILLHKGAGGELPEALLNKVIPFHFMGGLDLKTGMKLAKEIIRILG